jgi:hypothetical protein
MAVPSPPKPPPTPAEIQADTIKNAQQQMNTCIENAMVQFSQTDRTSTAHEKVVASCTAAFSAVQDGKADHPANKS